MSTSDIRKEMGWECPVDRTIINVLCQLHEVYVEEKMRRTDEEVASSRLSEKRGPREKGKEKVLAYKHYSRSGSWIAE